MGQSRVRNVPLENGDIVSDDLTTFGGSASFEHALFLKRVINGTPKHPRRRPRWRDWRWENQIKVFFDGSSPDFDQLENPVGGFEISSGVVFRNTWGVFRVQVAYVDAEGI